MGDATVLAVEDDRVLATMMKEMLVHTGYTVVQAFTGESAITLALQSPPDIILLDVLLPGMDGFAVLKELRGELKMSHVPVIMLTALDAPDFKVKAFNLLATDYLTKPFNNDELLARVKGHIYTMRSARLAPLTGLPSGTLVEEAIQKKLHSGEQWALLYLDLDHFKALNDRYGFLHGNTMIRLFKDVLVAAVQHYGNLRDFIGHVGGEDFVVLTTVDHIHTICQEIIRTFMEQTVHLYDSDDRARGAFAARDRNGSQRLFPLITVSIAVLLPQADQIRLSMDEVSRRVAHLKSQSKLMPGNCYIVEGENFIHCADGDYNMPYSSDNP